MDRINTSKQASVKDFVSNAEKALGSQIRVGVTQRTFGGSVVVFGSTGSAPLILGI